MRARGSIARSKAMSAILIVALGANDGLRGVPVAQLTDNLSHIIEAAQKRGIAVLLCGMEALPIHGWEYTVAFHQAYVDLRGAISVPLVPFMLLNIIGNPALMQCRSRASERRRRARDRRRDLAVSGTRCSTPSHAHAS